MKASLINDFIDAPPVYWAFLLIIFLLGVWVRSLYKIMDKERIENYVVINSSALSTRELNALAVLLKEGIQYLDDTMKEQSNALAYNDQSVMPFMMDLKERRQALSRIYGMIRHK